MVKWYYFHYIRFCKIWAEASNFIKKEKRLWPKFFPVNFVKFLRITFFTEHLRWLILQLPLIFFNGVNWLKFLVNVFYTQGWWKNDWFAWHGFATVFDLINYQQLATLLLCFKFIIPLISERDNAAPWFNSSVIEWSSSWNNKHLFW